MHMQHGSEKM